ncbi:MAG: hypothetical protein Q8N21_03560 [bacterium]|nr:hypothetical protein [bacterium]
MRKMKQLIIATALFALILPTAALAAIPESFSVRGNVIISGEDAPIGTVITVENDSKTIAATTVTVKGKYLAEIPKENIEKTLTYKIDGFPSISQIANPAGAPLSQNIDLIFVAMNNESTPTPTTNTNSGSTGTSGGTSGGTTPPSPPQPPVIKKDEPLVQKQEEEVVVLGVEADYRAIQLNKIINEAGYVWKGDASVIAGNMAVGRDPKAEVSGYNKYTALLISGMDGLKRFFNIYAITNFIVYGTPTTEILGAGERAGVLNSYKSAFGKLPTTESEWQDAIKIANGRWPNERSEAAETKAKKEFKKVYKREPDMNNPNDNAAVTVIAYGLRPDARNLNSEKAAIKTFKHIYRYNPSSAADWDIVRAIAYSGAKR